MSEIPATSPVYRVHEIDSEVLFALAHLDALALDTGATAGNTEIASELPSGMTKIEVAELGIKVRIGNTEYGIPGAGIKGEIRAVKWIGETALNSDPSSGLITFVSCLERLDDLKRDAPVRATIARTSLRRKLSNDYRSNRVKVVSADTQVSSENLPLRSDIVDDPETLARARQANIELAGYLLAKVAEHNLLPAHVDIDRHAKETEAKDAMEALVESRKRQI